MGDAPRSRRSVTAARARGARRRAAASRSATRRAVDVGLAGPHGDARRGTCPLGQHVDAAVPVDVAEVEPGEGPHPWNNTVSEWQTAVDCALAAAQAQQGFKLIVWLQGIDSKVGTGYYGVAAESYMLATIAYDSYPPASAVQRTCASLSMIAGCTIDLGQPCLTCDSPGADAQLCDGA